MTNITNYLRWAARGAVTSVFFWLETVFMLGLVSMAAGCPVWQWMVVPAGVGILIYLGVYAVRSHYQLYLVEQQRVMERLGGNGRS
jgi:threonine/homoserine/homoserine lactone efflux protein